MPLALKSRFVGNVGVIQCVGAIVLGEEVKVLEALLEAKSFEFTRIVLNMAEVNRLDSIGMGLLVRYVDRLGRRGGGIRLAASPAFVTRLLEMTKLDDVLPEFPTEDAAILSFLEQGPEQASTGKRGPRVIMFDPSSDLCVFVRTVLTRHGFDVRTTCSFHDAKILLRVDTVDYILVGPSASGPSAETMGKSLQTLAPGAGVLQLGEDFKMQDAEKSAQELLQLFGIEREL